MANIFHLLESISFRVSIHKFKSQRTSVGLKIKTGDSIIFTISGDHLWQKSNWQPTTVVSQNATPYLLFCKWRSLQSGFGHFCNPGEVCTIRHSHSTQRSNNFFSPSSCTHLHRQKYPLKKHDLGKPSSKRSSVSMDTFRTPLSPPPPGSTDD